MSNDRLSQALIATLFFFSEERPAIKNTFCNQNYSNSFPSFFLSSWKRQKVNCCLLVLDVAIRGSNIWGGWAVIVVQLAEQSLPKPEGRGSIAVISDFLFGL